MNITKFDKCKAYYPPKHDKTVHAMHLQHKSMGCDAPYWVGCSYYLPGAKAEMDVSPLHKIYVILEGAITIESKGGETVVLNKGDSIHIGPDEYREVRNETNGVATMLVIMPYPEN